MPVFNQFCCCCNLKTGGVIYGWLGLIGCISNIAAASALLANLDDFTKGNMAVRFPLHMALASTLSGAVIMAIAHALLILGASRGNRFLVLPWLVSYFIGLVAVGLFVMIGGPVILCTTDTGIGAAVLGVGLPIFGLELYLWLCVLSLFQHMREEEQPQLISMSAPKTLEDISQGYNPPSYDRLENVPIV